MAEQDTVQMDADERDAFLGNGGDGVISLAADGEMPPHSIPVSYGYDAAERTFYFRLAAESDSEKGELDARPVSFVVHGKDDGEWRSVVAKGRLEPVDDEDVATDSLAGLERVTIPLVDIFGTPSRLVAFEFYRLVPDELTSRKEASTAV